MSNNEVGWADNGPQRLPQSVVGEAQRGDSAYGPGANNFAKPGMLDVGDTGGIVGKPSVGGDYAFGGITKSASVAGPIGEVETTYNHENLSAKYKYPNVHQDVPTLGKPATTFSDHT